MNRFDAARRDIEDIVDRVGFDTWAIVNAVRRRYADPLEKHPYLSTACFHGEHDYCKNDRGTNGAVSWAKMPGECKFCGSPCACPCHRESDEQA